MTKVTILGQELTEKKELKMIEFVKWLTLTEEFGIPSNTPRQFRNIILLQTKYTIDKLDLMYAYDTDVNCGVLYLGHFNDGIV